MLLNLSVCKLLPFSHSLQTFMLPCPFKKLTGIDCPGCGFQRSVFALFHGDLHKSFYLYPATIPLLILFVMSILNAKGYFNRKELALKVFIYLTGGIILVSYLYKVFSGNLRG
jgi:Protein of unknown function (DUF2752)